MQSKCWKQIKWKKKNLLILLQKSVVSIRFCGFCDFDFLNLKNKITERIAPPIKTIATIIPPTIPPTFVVFEDFDPGDVVVVWSGDIVVGAVYSETKY